MIRCPTCHLRTMYRDNPFRPFCSERCKMIDLGKWASDVYRFTIGPEAERVPEESGDSFEDG